MDDYQNFKDLVVAIIKLTMTGDKALADGYQWTDWFAVLPALLSFAQTVNGTDMSRLDDAIKNLTDDQRTDLNETLATLDLESDRSEEIGKEAVRVAVEIMNFTELLRNSKK